MSASIVVVRGDSAPILFTSSSFEPGIYKFAIKRNKNWKTSEEYVLEKTIVVEEGATTILFEITPEESEALDIGAYRWGLRYKDDSPIVVRTLQVSGSFNVIGGVIHD